ncbi:MAG TPA: magnesium/cobalt transporter CorA [Polyangiaceae bacterium]|nr:magnesium/cobalt transporter CorA [Polyangiaceae bacterium]
MEETVDPERGGGEEPEEAPPNGDLSDERESEAPTSEERRRRTQYWKRRVQLPHEPSPGASPGTLMPQLCGDAPRIFLMDYDQEVLAERELESVEECIPYLVDDRPSITWIDVRGIGQDPSVFMRLGEIFKIHPLALEDIVNVPQRPKADMYTGQQIIIGRMVRLDCDGVLKTEQLGILFGKTFVLTVQENPDEDVLERVRERIRKGRGKIRSGGADYLAYAIVDAVIDGFYPVLEKLGERIEDMELDATLAKREMSKSIHDVKRDLLTIRRAIWPQRDLLNTLLREESPLISKETRIYLRDTYDHAVQVMDMVETFREIASGLMDLYLSGVSNRMNEIMKVLTILSTIFLPITAIGGIYGMNFHHEVSPYNMPELDWRYGYPFALGLMSLSVIGLLFYYRKKGWIQKLSDDGRDAARAADEERRDRAAKG